LGGGPAAGGAGGGAAAAALGDLPEHLVASIVRRLPARARARASAACRGWRDLLGPEREPGLWRRADALELLSEYHGELLGATLAWGGLLRARGVHVRELSLRGFRTPAPAMLPEPFRTAQLPHLVSCDLSGSSAGGEVVYWALVQCPGLLELNADDCDLDADASWVDQMGWYLDKERSVMGRTVTFALRELRLRNCFRSGAALNKFLAIVGQACPDLEGLALGWEPRALSLGAPGAWGGARCAVLGGLRGFHRQRLSALSLAGCAALRDLELAGLLRVSGRSLRRLNLANCSQVSGHGLAQLDSPHLDTLNLQNLWNVPGRAFSRLLVQNPQLVRLSFAWTDVETADLEAGLPACRHLRALDLSGCARVEAARLPELLRGLRGLSELGCGGTAGLTDQSLRLLLRDHPGIRALGLVHSPCLTERSLAALPALCPRLESVCLTGNPQLGPDAVLDLTASVRLKRVGAADMGWAGGRAAEAEKRLKALRGPNPNPWTHMADTW